MKKIMMIMLASMLIPSAFADNTSSPNQQTGKESIREKRNSRERSPGTMRNNQSEIRNFFASLTEDERKELRELQRSNPEEAKKIMTQKLEQYKLHRKEKDKQLKDLIKTYQQAENKESKEQAYAEIKKMVTEDFNTNLAEHKRQLDFLERRLKAERERYDIRSKNADRIIKNRIDELVKVPELRW